MSTELKELADGLRSSWSQFKTENDRRLDEIERNGRASAETVEKVNKINADVTRVMADIAEIRRMQTVSGLAAASNISDEAAAAAFHRTLVRLRGANAPSSFSAKDLDAYRSAIGAYIRGDDGVRASMQVGKDSNGGYFVLPTMDGRIVTKLFESSPMRQLCSSMTIGTDSYRYVVDNDEAGVGYTSEIGTRTETDTPDVSMAEVVVHEMYAEPKVTNKLLEDAEVDVEAWLAAKAADKFARYEAVGAISHTGVGQLRGFLSRTIVTTTDATRAWGQLQYVASGASGAFASSAPGDCLISALFALKARYRANATWLMSSTTEAEVRKLKDGQGNYLWQPNFQDGVGATLLGRPIASGEDMPALAANSYSIAVADWKAGYLFVDRRGISLLRDPYTSKGWTKFHFTRRVGGDVIDSDAIKVVKFASS